MGQYLLSNKRVSLASTEVYSQLYVVSRRGLLTSFESILYFSQMMRQGANSAVRFTTYATLKQFVQGTARPGQRLPSAITFGIGGIAGLVTVYTTMPLE
jgi:solute carrier family 25 citrate transporter 1